MNSRILKTSRRGLMIMALACAAQRQAQAISQVYYWDTNGSTAGSSSGTTAPGTWDSSPNATADWNTNSAGTLATTTWLNTGNTTAYFSAGTNATGSYSVTMANSAAVSVNMITFAEGTVTIAPGTSSTLTLSGANPTINVASGLTANIDQAMGGTTGNGLTTAGTGTLFLGAQNTYLGSTNIYGATIMLGINNALPIDGVINTVLAGPHLDLNGFNQKANNPAVVTNSSTTLSTYTIDNTVTSGGYASFGGAISGNTAVVFNSSQSGANGWEFNGADSFTGGLTVNGGGVELTNAKTFSGGVTVNTGAVLQVDSDAALGATTGNAVTLNGGTFVSTQSYSTARNLTIGANGGIFNISTGKEFTDNGSVSESGLITTAGAGTVDFVGAITGSGGLTNSGTGTVILAAANTYSGATTVSAGSLITGIAGALPSATDLVVNGSATVDVAGYGQTVGTLSSASNATSTVTNSSVTPATLTINSSTITGNGISYYGVIGGNLSLVKSGTGTQQLFGASTYTGSTTINGGSLVTAAANALPVATAVTIGSSGTLNLNGQAVTIGSLSGSGSAALGDGNLTVNSAATTTYSGSITDSNGGGLTLNGGGNLTLAGNNTYTGATTLDDGSLQISSASNLGTGPLNLNQDGVLILNGSFTLPRNITVFSSGGINVSTGNTVTLTDTPVGALSGNGLVEFAGYGTTVLIGSNSSLTGGIDVFYGTLSVDNDAELGAPNNSMFVGAGTAATTASFSTSRSIAIQSVAGGTFAPAASTTFTLNTGLTGTGPVNIAGAGTVAFAASSSESGPLTVSSGTLQVSANLTPSSIYIGGPASATVSQTAGTITDAGTAYIATHSGDIGNYNLSGGTLSVGTDFTLGVDNPANANFVLSGTGNLSVTETEYVSGTFTQGTGTTNTAHEFAIGYDSGSAGAYTLNDGTLNGGVVENLGYMGSSSFTQNGGTHNATEIFISASAPGQTSVYNMTAGNLNITGIGDPGDLYIGAVAKSSASFTQSGGSNVSIESTLDLSHNIGLTSSYTLSGTGTLSAAAEYIGEFGAGTFTQSDTSSNTTTFMDIAANEGSTGTYNMNGGTLTVTGANGNVFVGDYDSGSFNQTAGSISISIGLYLGRSAAGAGTYSLSGTGSLTAGLEAIGGFGSGLFTQTGGSNTVSGTLSVSSPGYPTSGTYDMQAGTLSAGSLQDNAVFTQEIGSPAVTVTGSLVVAHGGIYNLNAGTVSASSADIGDPGAPAGTGVLNIATGGSLTVSSVLTLETTGTINLNTGGSFSTVNLNNNGQINLNGGTYNVSGTTSGTGTIAQTGGTTAAADGTQINNSIYTVKGAATTFTSPGSVSFGVTADAVTTATIGLQATATITGNLNLANSGSLATGTATSVATVNVSNQASVTAHEINGGNVFGGTGTLNLNTGSSVSAAGINTSNLTITNSTFQIVTQPSQANDDPDEIGAIAVGYSQNGAVTVAGTSTVTAPVIKLGPTDGDTGTWTQTNGTTTTTIFAAGNDANVDSVSGVGTAAFSGGTMNTTSLLVGGDDSEAQVRRAGVAAGHPQTDPDGGTVSVVTISGTATVTAASTHITTNGEVDYAGGSFSPGDLTIDGGGLMVVDPSTNGSLQGVGIQPLTATPKVLTLNSVTLTGSSQLDLNNNDADIHNNSLSSIVNYLQSGFSHGSWSGAGIISSTAAANPTLRALGVELNATQNLSTGAYSTTQSALSQWQGITVALDDVLVQYTIVGDADLSGSVTIFDYSLIDNGYDVNQGYYAAHPGGTSPPLTGWHNGDFNYDGVINGDDYSLIDNSFNTEGNTNINSAVGTPIEPVNMIANDTEQISVPEPAAATLLAIALPALLRRRRRRNI